MYMSLCNISDGIKVLHGNRGYFHINKQPLFPAIYETVENYQLDAEPLQNFFEPLKSALKRTDVITSNCGKVWPDLIRGVGRLLEYNRFL